MYIFRYLTLIEDYSWSGHVYVLCVSFSSFSSSVFCVNNFANSHDLADFSVENVMPVVVTQEKFVYILTQQLSCYYCSKFQEKCVSFVPLIS